MSCVHVIGAPDEPMGADERLCVDAPDDREVVFHLRCLSYSYNFDVAFRCLDCGFDTESEGEAN